MQAIETILKKLSHYPHKDEVGNPYAAQYALDNLRLYFEYMLNETGKRVLLVGEAPGYKGCRITGIPFTSGKIFCDIAHPLLQELRTKITLPTIEAERTAAVVWNYLLEKRKTPFFWNSFPFHPHLRGTENSNRPPTNSEIEFGAEILAAIVKMYKPEVIAGIGRSGIKALKLVFPNQTFTYIRHPSKGGKLEFIKGMNSVI